MVMTLHKLTAGTGYEYFTRNVAAMDSTEKGHLSLADYYSLKGEKPGHWVGSGLAGIDGLEAGDVVTADQMLSLFGLGDHPLATERLAALTRATDRDIRDAMQLGQRFGVYPGMTDFSIELTQRISDWNLAHGRAASDSVPAEVRAELRTEVGREAFRKRFGRDPLDSRELSGFIVRAQRPVRSGVSGYDATFSPVKSVSALWALADPETSAAIARCHDRAVADSLRYLEDKAIYTRRGRNGVRQVKTLGIVAASFTHRDSRAGDPDLHTHVAIANKVQAADDGAWLAIDGRIMFKGNVTVSEFYNTALEKHLTHELGVRFVDRPGSDPERPVREILGVDPALLARWSQRDKMVPRASPRPLLLIDHHSARRCPDRRARVGGRTTQEAGSACGYRRRPDHRSRLTPRQP